MLIDREHKFLQAIGIMHVEVSCCDVLHEVVMHAVFAPPLRHVDNLTDVDPIPCAYLALVDFVQLLLVQKPCQLVHL